MAEHGVSIADLDDTPSAARAAQLKEGAPLTQRPFTIALTGGPCAGKTTLLERLREHGDLDGHPALFVPEAATMLVKRGLVIGQDVRHFQTETMRLQLQLEVRAWRKAAALGGQCVVVCDRGTLDGAGYCTPEVFSAILADLGWSRTRLAARYDAVIHLVSAAIEAPDAYTIDNNDARHETLDEAIAQELRTQEAWKDHPNRIVIRTPEGFQHKMHLAMAAILHELSAR